MTKKKALQKLKEYAVQRRKSIEAIRWNDADAALQDMLKLAEEMKHFYSAVSIIFDDHMVA